MSPLYRCFAANSLNSLTNCQILAVICYYRCGRGRVKRLGLRG